MILSSSDRYEILTTALTLNWRLSTTVLSKVDHYGNNKQKNLKTISFKEQVRHIFYWFGGSACQSRLEPYCTRQLNVLWLWQHGVTSVGIHERMGHNYVVFNANQNNSSKKDSYITLYSRV